MADWFTTGDPGGIKTALHDLGKVWTSLLNVDGPNYKFFDLPLANYGSANYDSVVDEDGTVVGYSMFTGYSANERRGLSLATVDPNVPDFKKIKLINYDYAKYGASAERRRLIARWERDVNSLPK